MSIGNNITALYLAGAREFLILNVPNLAITPGVRVLASRNPAIAVAAEQLSAGFNSGLGATLGFLENTLPGVRFEVLDTLGLLNRIVADPGRAGIANATEPCLRFGVVGAASCRQPDRHLFWDAAHPTRAGHAALADAAQELLEAP